MAGRNDTPLSRAELEQELSEARTQQELEGDQGQARLKLHKLVHDDIDFWYTAAKTLVVFGDSRTDQVKATIIKMVWDKIAPDLKSIGRGSGGGRVAAMVKAGFRRGVKGGGDGENGAGGEGEATLAVGVKLGR